MTIFCSPAEMLLPALGVEAAWSAVTDTCTQAGLVRAAFTSRRIRGRGPSLLAVPWAEKEKNYHHYFVLFARELWALPDAGRSL